MNPNIQPLSYDQPHMIRQTSHVSSKQLLSHATLKGTGNQTLKDFLQNKKYVKVINRHKFEDTKSQLMVGSNNAALKGDDVTESGLYITKMDTDSASNPSLPNRYRTVMIQGSNKAIIQQSQIMKSLDTKSAPYANQHSRATKQTQFDIDKQTKGKFDTKASSAYKNTQEGFYIMQDMLNNVEINDARLDLSRQRNTSSKNLQYSYTDNDKRLDDTELISTESPEVTKMGESTNQMNRKGSIKEITRLGSSNAVTVDKANQKNSLIQTPNIQGDIIDHFQAQKQLFHAYSKDNSINQRDTQQDYPGNEIVIDYFNKGTVNLQTSAMRQLHEPDFAFVNSMGFPPMQLDGYYALAKDEMDSRVTKSNHDTSKSKYPSQNDNSQSRRLVTKSRGIDGMSSQTLLRPQSQLQPEKILPRKHGKSHHRMIMGSNHEPMKSKSKRDKTGYDGQIKIDLLIKDQAKEEPGKTKLLSEQKQLKLVTNVAKYNSAIPLKEARFHSRQRLQGKSSSHGSKAMDRKISHKYLAINSSQLSNEGITTPLNESKYIPRKTEDVLNSMLKNEYDNADLITVQSKNYGRLRMLQQAQKEMKQTEMPMSNLSLQRNTRSNGPDSRGPTPIVDHEQLRKSSKLRYFGNDEEKSTRNRLKTGHNSIAAISSHTSKKHFYLLPQQEFRLPDTIQSRSSHYLGQQTILNYLNRGEIRPPIKLQRVEGSPFPAAQFPGTQAPAAQEVHPQTLQPWTVSASAQSTLNHTGITPGQNHLIEDNSTPSPIIELTNNRNRSILLQHLNKNSISKRPNVNGSKLTNIEISMNLPVATSGGNNSTSSLNTKDKDVKVLGINKRQPAFEDHQSSMLIAQQRQSDKEMMSNLDFNSARPMKNKIEKDTIDMMNEDKKSPLIVGQSFLESNDKTDGHQGSFQQSLDQNFYSQFGQVDQGSPERFQRNQMTSTEGTHIQSIKSVGHDIDNDLINHIRGSLPPKRDHAETALKSKLGKLTHSLSSNVIEATNKTLLSNERKRNISKDAEPAIAYEANQDHPRASYKSTSVEPVHSSTFGQLQSSVELPRNLSREEETPPFDASCLPLRRSHLVSTGIQVQNQSLDRDIDLIGAGGSQSRGSQMHLYGLTKTKTTPTLTIPKEMSPGMNATSARYQNNSQDEELSGVPPLKATKGKNHKKGINGTRSNHQYHDYETYTQKRSSSHLRSKHHQSKRTSSKGTRYTHVLRQALSGQEFQLNVQSVDTENIQSKRGSQSHDPKGKGRLNKGIHANKMQQNQYSHKQWRNCVPLSIQILNQTQKERDDQMRRQLLQQQKAMKANQRQINRSKRSRTKIAERRALRGLQELENRSSLSVHGDNIQYPKATDDLHRLQKVIQTGSSFGASTSSRVKSQHSQSLGRGRNKTQGNQATDPISSSLPRFIHQDGAKKAKGSMTRVENLMNNFNEIMQEIDHLPQCSPSGTDPGMLNASASQDAADQAPLGERSNFRQSTIYRRGHRPQASKTPSSKRDTNRNLATLSPQAVETADQFEGIPELDETTQFRKTKVVNRQSMTNDDDMAGTQSEVNLELPPEMDNVANPTRKEQQSSLEPHGNAEQSYLSPVHVKNHLTLDNNPRSANLGPINTDINCTEQASTIQLHEDQSKSKQNSVETGKQKGQQISFTDKVSINNKKNKDYLLRNYQSGNYAKNIKNSRRRSNDLTRGAYLYSTAKYFHQPGSYMMLSQSDQNTSSASLKAQEQQMPLLKDGVFNRWAQEPSFSNSQGLNEYLNENTGLPMPLQVAIIKSGKDSASVKSLVATLHRVEPKFQSAPKFDKGFQRTFHSYKSAKGDNFRFRAGKNEYVHNVVSLKKVFKQAKSVNRVDHIKMGPFSSLPEEDLYYVNNRVLQNINRMREITKMSGIQTFQNNMYESREKQTKKVGSNLVSTSQIDRDDTPTLVNNSSQKKDSHCIEVVNKHINEYASSTWVIRPHQDFQYSNIIPTLMVSRHDARLGGSKKLLDSQKMQSIPVTRSRTKANASPLKASNSSDFVNLQDKKEDQIDLNDRSDNNHNNSLDAHPKLLMKATSQQPSQQEMNKMITQFEQYNDLDAAQ